jgi:hypothetical protein
MGEFTLIINLDFVKLAGLEKFEAWISEIRPPKRRERNMSEKANKMKNVIDREKVHGDSKGAKPVDMSEICPRCGEKTIVPKSDWQRVSSEGNSSLSFVYSSKSEWNSSIF